MMDVGSKSAALLVTQKVLTMTCTRDRDELTVMYMKFGSVSSREASRTKPLRRTGPRLGVGDISSSGVISSSDPMLPRWTSSAESYSAR